MSEAPEKIRTNAAGNAIVTPHPVWDTDVEYIRADHVDALLKQAREDALRWAERNLMVYAPTVVDGPEHDVGYCHGYHTAMNRILDMVESETLPKAKKPNLVGTGEVNVRDAARVALERFESCASGLVPDDYARGYREACDHIGQDAARVDALVTQAREDALREAAEIAIDYGKQQYIANVVYHPQYADDIADDAQEIAGEILALIGKDNMKHRSLTNK